MGREVLDKVFAQTFKTEKALVRIHFASGTHTLACALFGNLKYGDKLFIVEDSKAGCEAGKSFKQEYGNIIDIKIIGYTASMRFKEYKTEYTKKLINAGADIIAKTSEEIFKIIVD